jgi:hypothetical protein
MRQVWENGKESTGNRTLVLDTCGYNFLLLPDAKFWGLWEKNDGCLS